jgi:16S rRNA processing protein RimM
MSQLQLKQIGSFVKVHGIRGELILSLNESYTFELIDKVIKKGKAVFVEINGIPVPFFVSPNGLKELNQNSVLIKFDDTNEKLTNQMVSLKVFIESSFLTKIKDEKTFQPEDLIGYRISDEIGSFEGEVKEFINMKGNPMFSIGIGKKSMLFPVISDFILAVDSKRKTILVELPEGYLDAML